MPLRVASAPAPSPAQAACSIRLFCGLSIDHAPAVSSIARHGHLDRSADDDINPAADAFDWGA